MVNNYSEIIKKYSDPDKSISFKSIDSYQRDFLLKQIRSIILIRLAEEKISSNVETGIIKCPCHLGIGQEAIAVGISNEVRKTDRVFGAHRSHTHYLALNDDTYGLFAEILGKEDGCSKGMGGSMHIIDRENGFWGSVPIVGATVPIAVGAGLGAKMDGNSDIAISYFGDGSTEEGAVQESFNMASIMRLPVLFVCENNLFSSHMHIDLRQPNVSTARYAEAHKIPFELVNGNDVIEVYEAMKRASEHIRSGKGPYFLEMFTYRWKGHVGHRDDQDVGVQRKDDLAKWKKRDCLENLKVKMIQANHIDEKQYDSIFTQLVNKVDEDWDRALDAKYPPIKNLLDFVYA